MLSVVQCETALKAHFCDIVQVLLSVSFSLLTGSLLRFLSVLPLVSDFHLSAAFIYHSRRPRWLGRLSSCLLKSISRVQLSPSAHTRRNFLHKKLISGKRESVSY